MIGPLDHDDDVIGPLVRRGPLSSHHHWSALDILDLSLFYAFFTYLSFGLVWVRFFHANVFFFEILLVGVFW